MIFSKNKKKRKIKNPFRPTTQQHDNTKHAICDRSDRVDGVDKRSLQIRIISVQEEEEEEEETKCREEEKEKYVRVRGRDRETIDRSVRESRRRFSAE